nr:hypothetical protein BdHM001_14280 [Bdellovibrio sp. HM001]
MPEIGKRLGPVKQKQISELTTAAIRGNVPYHENLRRRIDVLKEVPISEVRDIVNSVPLNEELMQFVVENSSRCRVVTANLDVWVASYLDRLGVRYYTSNAVEKDDRIVELRNILEKKDIASNYDNVVAVGDGHNDAGMLEVAEIGIACGLVHRPASSLFQVATHVTYSEKALCRMLRQLL